MSKFRFSWLTENVMTVAIGGIDVTTEECIGCDVCTGCCTDLAYEALFLAILDMIPVRQLFGDLQ